VESVGALPRIKPRSAKRSTGENKLETASGTQLIVRTWPPSSSCAEGERNLKRGVLGREIKGGYLGFKPCRRAELHERVVQRVASLDRGEERKTGRSVRTASAKLEPGAENPTRPLLLRLIKL